MPQFVSRVLEGSCANLLFVLSSDEGAANLAITSLDEYLHSLFGLYTSLSPTSFLGIQPFSMKTGAKRLELDMKLQIDGIHGPNSFPLLVYNTM